MLLAGFAEAQWVPPIGIPTPSFGINETVESEHGDPDFSTHVVTGGGSLNTKMPGSLSPGDVVVIESGNYTVTGGTSWNFTGTASDPIFIRGESFSNKPVVLIGNGQDFLHILGSYIIVENFDVDLSGDAETGIGLDGDHLSFRHSEVRDGIGTTNTAIFLNGTQNVVYNNKVHDNGPLGDPGDPDFHGMGTDGTFIWFVDNEMYRNAGDGIQVNAGVASNARNVNHIYIGRNTAYENQQSGIWLKFTEDVIVSQNISFNHVSSSSSSGQGMGGQLGPERAWFIYNRIFDCEEGILNAGDGGPGGDGAGLDMYFVGNLIYNIERQGLVSWETSSRKHAVNNTIINAGTGIDYFNAVSGTEVVNNLIGSISGTDIDLDSNNGGTFAFNFCDGVACSMVDATCTNCSTGSPVFVDSDGDDNIAGNLDDDYRLQATSDAIDVGTVSGVYAEFQSRYGLSIAVDTVGTTRPQDTLWDAGAFEFTVVASTVFPGAPAGLGTTAGTTPLFSSNPTGLGTSASSSPIFPGATAGLGTTAGTTAVFPGVPTGLGTP